MIESKKIIYVSNILKNGYYTTKDEAIELVMNKLDEDESDLILWKDVPNVVDEYLRIFNKDEFVGNEIRIYENPNDTEYIKKLSYVSNVLFNTNFLTDEEACEIVMAQLYDDDSSLISWNDVPTVVHTVFDMINRELMFAESSTYFLPKGIQTLLKKLDSESENLTKVSLYKKTWNYINSAPKEERRKKFGNFPVNSRELFCVIDIYLIGKEQEKKKRRRSKKKKI